MKHRKDPHMEEKIKKVLEKVKPMLQADGGDVEFIEVQNGIVKVRLKGACSGCPMSQLTLKNGIERMLVKEVPGIKAVENVK
jgi:Fe-S cluster biogenesis protein NfuA